MKTQRQLCWLICQIRSDACEFSQRLSVRFGLDAVAQIVVCVRPVRESEWQFMPFALDLDVDFLSNAQSVFKLTPRYRTVLSTFA